MIAGRPSSRAALAIAFDREGTARDDDFGVGNRQRTVGRVDEAQRIGMLRRGRERRDVLTADGKEYGCALLGQGVHRRADVGHLDPVVAGRAPPWRALQRNQRNSRHRTRADRMPAHLGGKGVRCVDHMRDALVPDEVSKTRDTAEAADPRRQRMAERDLCPSGVGIDRIDLLADETVREPVGVSGSAQDEGAHV